MESKDAARTLFMEGYSQSDVARILKKSENTISKWAKDGDWKGKKVSMDLLENNSTQRIMELIDYQTEALHRKIHAWKEEDPDSIKLIDRGDIDALQKLHTTIKRDSKKFTDYCAVIKEFYDFLHFQNLDFAKESMTYADMFLQEKRKML